MGIPDAGDTLIRQAGPALIGPDLADQPAFTFPWPGAGPGGQPLLARVTRRHGRVNFRQRHESRGVDRYRELIETTERIQEVSLSILR